MCVQLRQDVVFTVFLQSRVNKGGQRREKTLSKQQCTIFLLPLLHWSVWFGSQLFCDTVTEIGHSRSGNGMFGLCYKHLTSKSSLYSFERRAQRERRQRKRQHSLEVGEDDQTDDEGHNGQGVTDHGQVVQTDSKLQGKSKKKKKKHLWFTMNQISCQFYHRSKHTVACLQH